MEIFEDSRLFIGNFHRYEQGRIKGVGIAKPFIKLSGRFIDKDNSALLELRLLQHPYSPVCGIFEKAQNTIEGSYIGTLDTYNFDKKSLVYVPAHKLVFVKMEIEKISKN